jgi:hypothetical protein
MKTKVVVQCISKKESQSYNKDNPIQTMIELQVPYDQKNIYFQLSGGSNFVLNTINKDAADMFTIGGSYEVLISPADLPSAS